MQLLVLIKSILTPEGRRRKPRERDFGTTVSSLLREPDLALRKPVLTAGVVRSQLQRVLTT
jgi:hypothetical protein